jgi:glyoxylase-like metal-dependent hydrolase (beta-lactamase superfamily II)
VYLIAAGERTMLVDASTRANRKRLERTLRKSGIVRLDWLFLTHSHFDHTENAEWIRTEFGAKIAMSRRDAEIAASGVMSFPAGTNPFSRVVANLLSRIPAGLASCEPFDIDLVIDGKTDLSELGFAAFFLPTPGHSSGSTSIIVEDEIAICGDAAFGVFGNDAFPPFADDVPQLLESWDKLSETGCTLFLPGHGSEISAKTLKESAQRHSANAVSRRREA